MIEVILILGKGVQADGSLPDIVQHEIQYAAQLCRQQPIRAILFSGDHWGLATSASIVPEAEAMRRFYKTATIGKIPAQVAVLCETQAKDTIGNLLFSKALLDERPWRHLLMLAAAEHLPRVQYIAEQVFGHDYELQYHGHQHVYTLRQYLHTKRYERLARWYAQWFFYRLGQHPTADWQRYHFMYHPNWLARVLARVVRRPVHR